MRACADSSFILRLVTADAGTQVAIAVYHRIGKPPLFFLPLHALEVRNAIFQRAFHQRRSISSGERQHIARERDATFARLELLLARRTLLDVTLDMDTAIARAAKLSAAHTGRLGARAIDLLHVASALTLEGELFLTTDARQAQLAKAEGRLCQLSRRFEGTNWHGTLCSSRRNEADFCTLSSQPNWNPVLESHQPFGGRAQALLQTAA